MMSGLEKVLISLTRPKDLSKYMTANIESLQHENEELNVIFETAEFGILLLRNRTIVRANAAMDAIFGYEQGGMIGQTTASWYVTDTDNQAMVAGYEKMWRGEMNNQEMPLYRKDRGSTFYARMCGRAIDRSDPSRGTVWMIEDISIRKQQEVELKITFRLRSLLRFIGCFPQNGGTALRADDRVN
jgi:PAS domain S-box-containing protein